MARRKDGEGSIRKLKDGSWECLMQSKYFNENGRPKRIKRKAKTEQEAIKNCRMALRAWEKEFERGRDIKIDKTRTFGSYMEEYVDNIVKNRGVTGSTYKSYIYALNANFYNYKISRLQLHMLNTVEFELYFDTITHDKSRRTASLPIQLCKQLSTWLYGKSLIPEDYAKFTETKYEKKDEYFRNKENEEKNRKQIFTDEDIVKFYNSYKQNLSEYSCVILLQLETMMRGSEVLNLHLEDIDFDNNTITVRSTMAERFKDNDKTKGLEKYEKVPKGGKERVIYMSEFAKELVLYMMEQTNLRSGHNPNNLLYPSFLKHGKVRSLDAYEIQLKALCDKIGIDRDVRQRK
ncbi:MAG: tyrosine-type recombinase/integrase, partial [Blautia sp.]|nr:tyrosine-type recombinase/integrase [Blautia sp.]